MLIATAPAAVAQQFVDWTHPVNVAIRGDTVEKVRGCDGCDDAGAVSRQAIRSGDGYAEFTVGDADSFWVAGLSHRATTRLNDIDFAFRFNGGGWADVMENGVYQPGGDTPYGAGDVFRIAVRNGTVQYIRNGRVLRESATAPQYPLVFDAALGTIGASIRHARIDTGDNRAFSRYDAQEQYDRFDALDLNGDGVITLNEWRGPRRVFDELDADHNGRLTLHEFYNEDVVAQDVPEYAGTSGQTIRVDPRVRWTDTGIWIEQGDTVSFEADGTIQMSDNPDDKAGPAGSWTNRRALDAPLRQASAGSLIARIGNSPARLVGDRRTIDRAPVSGRLYLGVNDDYLEDNTGEYRVRITIERR